MSDPNDGSPPRYLRTPEAARFLSLSGRTLEKQPHLRHRASLSQARWPRRLCAGGSESLGRPWRQDVDLRSRRRDRVAR